MLYSGGLSQIEETHRSKSLAPKSMPQTAGFVVIDGTGAVYPRSGRLSTWQEAGGRRETVLPIERNPQNCRAKTPAEGRALCRAPCIAWMLPFKLGCQFGFDAPWLVCLPSHVQRVVMECYLAHQLHTCSAKGSIASLNVGIILHQFNHSMHPLYC